MLPKSSSLTDKHLDALEQNAETLLKLAHSIVEKRKEDADGTYQTHDKDVVNPKEVSV